MRHPVRTPWQLATHRVARGVLGGLMACSLGQNPALAQEGVTVLVQPGDTASALILPWLPEGATLEQMLVALLRANPEAFIDDNLNLLRAGQTLRLPTPAQVLQHSAEQAHGTVLEHHSRFREHARRLAEQARILPEAGALEMSGTVSQAQTERDGQGTGQDRLLLTKDLQDAQALQVALEKQTQEALTHLAALQKNIEQLQRLSQASPAPAVSAAEPHTALPSLPTWGWIATPLVLVLAGLLGWRLRRATARPQPTPPPAPVAVPPQLAGISLDLDSPAAAPGMDRRP